MSSHDKSVLEMLRFFNVVFDYLQRKHDYFELFSANDTRSEGWVKGELIRLLENNGFYYEVESRFGGHVIDFVLTFGGEQNLLELKSVCITERRRLSFYFSTRQITRDFDKLTGKAQKHKWALVAAYPCSEDEWRAQWNRVKTRFPNVECLRTRDFEIGIEGRCSLALFQVS